jgi:hemolysin-activating ACP:hemolysin acyltransferase
MLELQSRSLRSSAQEGLGTIESQALPPCAGSSESLLSEAIGNAVQLLLATERRAWCLAVIQAFVEPPARLGQIQFLFNGRGRPLGYASWAFLSTKSAEALSRDPNLVLELDEWNEGTELWIMDFVAPVGGARSLARSLRHRLSSHSTAKWLSRRENASSSFVTTRVRRVADWFQNA